MVEHNSFITYKHGAFMKISGLILKKFTQTIRSAGGLVVSETSLVKTRLWRAFPM